MILSKKAQYAIKALVTLAQNGAYPNAPKSKKNTEEQMLVRDLAIQAKVPGAFLGKIISELSSVGIINSRKGRGGGVSLTRNPKEIRLGECIEAIDRIHGQRKCVLEERPCREVLSCPLHPVASKIRVEILEKTTLAQVLGDGRWLV